VSRGENAVRVDAVRGLKPRAPELEIHRLFGAGVGVLLSFNLAFELVFCLERSGCFLERGYLLDMLAGNDPLSMSP
jgi:hypothetical protein